jgi:hypothetical protein
MDPSTPKLRAVTICVHIHIRGLRNMHMDVMEGSEKWNPPKKSGDEMYYSTANE